MSDSFLIINAQVPGYQGLQQIHIRWRKIETVASINEPSSPSDLPLLDAMGDWISLGGIDLQINGALGLAFPDLEPGQIPMLEKICKFLWQQGVDGFLPTIVTTSIDKIQRSLATVAQFISSPISDLPQASILGVHLEGPFLNPKKRGAHPEEFLLPLTLETIKQVLGDYASLVKVMTLAPELDEIGEVIPYLRSLGITVSLGHSLATATQAQQAFAHGASMVTHAFNAMPPLHHREPGLLAAAIAHPKVHCGLIADGKHVDPLMVDILLRAGKSRTMPSSCDEGIFLVSDALAPLGLPDGIYPWDSRQITVTQGTARLPDGTLSGTTLPLLVGSQNLVQWGICEPERAIALATVAPRQAINLPTNLVGQPAHLLRWHVSPTRDLSWQRI